MRIARSNRDSPPYAAQGALLVDMIFWTMVSEAALNAMESGDDPKGLEKSIAFLEEQLQESVAYVRLNLSKLQRTLMGTLR